MKFLHAADIHLDSPMAGLARRATVPAHVTHACTRRAFENLIDLAILEDVAFLLIAGDLYDADWKDFSTGLFFNDQMRRLGRPCIWIRGNHDAASLITKSLTSPPNVTVLSSRKVDRVDMPGLGVVLHGRSFPDRAVPEDISAEYPRAVPGMLNIGILHTSAENPGEHETYAPCRVEALVAKGYDYWALGHIHTRSILHQRPFVVFPGNIQGRNPRETGAKGATLVHVQDRAVTHIEHRDTDVLRWDAREIDIGGASNMGALSARLRLELTKCVETTAGRPVILRLALTGATSLHAALLADPATLEAECQNAASSAGPELYLEKIVLRTRMPPEEGAGSDLLAQLRPAFLAALDEPGVQKRLLEDFESLASLMPRTPERAIPRTVAELQAQADDAWLMVAELVAGGLPP